MGKDDARRQLTELKAELEKVRQARAEAEASVLELKDEVLVLFEISKLSAVGSESAREVESNFLLAI